MNPQFPVFIQKIYAPSSSLLQGKHLPFIPSPLRLNIFRLFVILSLTQLYRYRGDIYFLNETSACARSRVIRNTGYTCVGLKK
jgi:hypothetical protein